jgi:hypothetical protein
MSPDLASDDVVDLYRAKPVQGPLAVLLTGG